MKEFIKKVAFALFGVVLAFGVTATPALAAEPTTNVKISNIIYSADKGGDVATAYRLVKYKDGGNDYEFVDDNFKSYITAKKNNDSVDEITYLSGLENSEVATLMTSYMRNWSVKPAAYGSSATAESGNTATLQSLEPGYYLILVESKNGSSYSPMVVFVRYDGASTAKAYGTADGTIGGDTSELGNDGIVAKRSDAITIDKKVLRNNGTGWHETKTVQAGDEVVFRIAVTYPKYEENVDPHATLYDTLTNLKVASAADIALYSDEDCKSAIQDGLTANVGDYGSNNTQAVTASINWGNVPEVTSGSTGTVYISYKATVMQKAAVTGEANNSAYVEYLTSAANDQSSYTTTAKSETKLYSFAFDLKKVKGEDGAALSGAQFKVYTDENKTDQVYFTELGDGSYVVSAQSAGNAVGTVDAKFGGEKNQLMIYGLDPFTYYYFEEVTTPAGYVKPTGMFKLDLSSKMDTASDADNASGEHSGDLNGTWKTTDEGYGDNLKKDSDVLHSKFYAVSANDDDLVDVDAQYVKTNILTAELKNATTAKLPTTGGMGTVIFTVVGVALMAGAAGVLVVRRRKQD